MLRSIMSFRPEPRQTTAAVNSSATEYLIHARFAAGVFLVMVAFSTPLRLRAQTSGAIRIEAVEAWIKGGVDPQRTWNRAISKVGISFTVDRPTEVRLRRIGASDEWIAMLKRARVSENPAVTADIPQSTSNPTSPIQPFPNRAAEPSPQRRSTKLTREELRPLYYSRLGALSFYVTRSNLRETGGAVSGVKLYTSNDTIPLQSVPLHKNPIFVGLETHINDFGVMLEGHFQSNLMILNMGLSLDPFLPIGTTHLRIIAGVTPFISETRQIIGHLKRAPGDTAYNAIELHNGVVGGDVRTGLAYHFQPGTWASLEWGYRFATTAGRQLSIPGDRDITEGISWSKWSARGDMWRLAFTF